MKHTKNTHHVVLDTHRKYTVLKRHKGQNLILIKGEQPAQRWVDDYCFSKQSNQSDVSPVKSNVLNIEDALSRASLHMRNKQQKNKKLYKNKVGQNLLVLSWHNAFCQTHSYKKECKRSLLSFGKERFSETHFVLHGLWPQPRSNMYCGISKKEVGMDKHKQWRRLPDLDLHAEVVKGLKRVMPGFKSGLHKHEWVKHGSCYGADANSYYADAIALVDQVNSSKVGDFFSRNIGKSITLKQVRYLFDSSFGTGAGKRVEMKCRGGLITELWLHLGKGTNKLETLFQKGKITRSHCQKGRIDKAGFTKETSRRTGFGR